MASPRTQFMRYRKMLPSGSGARKRTSRQQWVMEQCSWLAPYLKQRTSQSTLDVSDVSEEMGPTDIFDSMSESSDTSPPSQGKVCEQTKRPIPRPPSSSKPTKKQCGEKRDSEELHLMKNLSSVLEATEGMDTNDEDSVFGKYVVTALMLISNKKIKATLKHKVQNVIFEAKMKDLESE